MEAGGIRRAWLLVGPTGSGKSPLGDALARVMGWAHLDFGQRLRQVARGELAGGLSSEEIALIRTLIESNALFPQDSYATALRILDGFLAGLLPGQGVILNGLPRHVGQALGLRTRLMVVRVVVLECEEQTVLERVRRRVGGASEDHAGRDDDASADVRRKLEVYARSTRPLVRFYEELGVPILRLRVEVETTAAELARAAGPGRS